VNKRVNMTVVGAFVIAAIGLGVVSLLVLSSGQLFRDTFQVVSLFDGSVQGLQLGAPVTFRGVQIGTVKDVRIGLTDDPRFVDPGNTDMRVPVIYEIDNALLTARGGAQELTSERLGELVATGLKAQLNTESFVTGRLLISLDFYPDQPGGADDVDWGYPQIPTVATPIEEIQQQIAGLFDKLEDLDLQAVIDATEGTLVAITDFVEDPEVRELTESLDETLANLDATMASFRGVAEEISANVTTVSASAGRRADQLETVLTETENTLVALQGALDPESPLTIQLGLTLAEFGRAARALAALADALEQNPSAVIRGREVPPNNRPEGN